ncbi:hypothetical protein, partial [Escherichia coli]|uniref:hypothetical protein n=1 Tax=Escherichia coli TaxID=562 RepID=UPI0032E4262F
LESKLLSLLPVQFGNFSRNLAAVCIVEIRALVADEHRELRAIRDCKLLSGYTECDGSQRIELYLQPPALAGYSHGRIWRPLP